MIREGKVLLGVVALAGAGALVAGPVASAQGDSQTVYADVDGDGTANVVTVRLLDESTQSITFDLPQGPVETTAPAQLQAPQPPRVTDVNRDGAAEVAVTTVTGANTQHFQLFKYEPAIGVVAVDGGGAPFTFYEGGGISARSGYQCEDPGKGPMLRIVSAQYDFETETYDGTTSWLVQSGNSISEWTRAPFSDLPADDPQLNLDPTTCAP
ncbi:hypothetical protein SAMN05660874_00169 [Saccharopolyspora flava]|uniref:VCBS repeat-containing protein n=1 Tax=Saccharopolyspora flava TaxID=95161 RepID=A0A1I6NVL3_9PSEU|nr:hypothetical protein SAMN05660874_00169 [Saccharopolyspora flava]